MKEYTTQYKFLLLIVYYTWSRAFIRQTSQTTLEVIKVETEMGKLFLSEMLIYSLNLLTLNVN